jgi:hypothetical protein
MPHESRLMRCLRVLSLALTLLITNVTKLAGLAIAINEALVRSELRPAALAVAGLMMIGAQGSETVLTGFIDKLFAQLREAGKPPSPPES